MKYINLKARILVPMALASGLVIAAFMLAIDYKVSAHLAEDSARSIQIVEGLYQTSLEERAHKLGAALEVIAADTTLRLALVAHDRETLLARAMPIFLRMKAEHNITHFYFHDQHRINILRVHQPDRYGDRIDRFTALGAEKSRALFHGVEMGPLGTFTLRAVLPVRDGDTLLGYIELGEEVDQIIQDMGHVFGMDLIVAINKQYLSKTDWVSGMTMLGRDSHWERFADWVIVSQTPGAPTDSLGDILSHLRTGQVLPPEDIEVIQAGRRYQCRRLTLRDAGKRTVGGMVVLRDITARTLDTQKTVATFGGGAVVIGMGLVLLFYIILNRTDRQLKDLLEELRLRKQRLSNAQRMAHLGSWEWHVRNNALHCSAEAARILESDTENAPSRYDELVGLIHPADRDDFKYFIEKVQSGNNPHELIHRIVRRDGSERTVRHNAEVVRDTSGEVLCINATIHDVTASQQAEARIAHMGRILEHSWDEIYVFDADTLLFIEVSNGASQNLGYSMEEMRQLTPLDLKPDFTHDQFVDLLSPLRQGEKQQICFEIEHQRKNGSRYPVEVRLQFSQDAKSLVFIAIIKDISEQKRYIKELEHKALYDTLTELPNRSLMGDRLEHALKIARRETTSIAVLMVDVMRLREINDLLGHQTGDLVLKEVAHRLQKGLRESDTVSRLGGDEFVIILPGVDIEQAQLSARKIQKLLEQSVVVGDSSLEIELAIGIAHYPDHGDAPAILLQHADIAMREAKIQSNGFAIYDTLDDPFSIIQLKLHGELRQAISSMTLAVYYQPKVDITSGRVISVEALARWPHPIEGMISPADFIPMVERSGLIRPFTLWVLEVAIKQARCWADAGIDLTVAVNLSTRNLLDPDLANSIEQLLAHHRVSSDRLILEITESAIMARPERAMKVLTRLHTMGLKLSIDDFGTGYSSLAYLKQLPVAELKIDYSFVSRINDSESDAVIVRSTIDLAHNLGLKVVAEGVETREILDLLAILGCDTAQGYYFSRPLPAEEFSTWLAESTWGTAT